MPNCLIMLDINFVCFLFQQLHWACWQLFLYWISANVLHHLPPAFISPKYEIFLVRSSVHVWNMIHSNTTDERFIWKQVGDRPCERTTWLPGRWTSSLLWQPPEHNVSTIFHHRLCLCPFHVFLLSIEQYPAWNCRRWYQDNHFGIDTYGDDNDDNNDNDYKWGW